MVQRRILRQWIPFVGGALIVSALLNIRWAPAGEPVAPEILFRRVLDLTRHYYVDDFDERELVEEGLDRMVRTLDRNNRFIPAADSEKSIEEIEGKFTGIGIVLSAQDAVTLSILEVLEGGPADDAGVRAGDRILAIDGTGVEAIGAADPGDLERKAAERIQGPEGTSVTLRITTPGSPPREVKATRRQMPRPSVYGVRILDGERGIGYLRIHQFQERTAPEFDDAVGNLRKAGMKAFVLDLRGNAGGLLDEGIEVARRLIPEGVIVRQRGGRATDRAEEIAVANPEVAHPHYDLVILTNSGTASASEIVGGAVQDHRRGLLVGAPSFGKGSVQSIYPVWPRGYSSGALKLTTRRYFTPDGRTLSSKQALVPDVRVEQPQEEWQEILNRWTLEYGLSINEPTRLRAEGWPPGSGPPPPDRVLDEALRVLRDPRRYQELLSRPVPAASEEEHADE